jgi:hypothetical protein
MTQTPPAMAAVMGLAVVATCTAKRFEVFPHGEGYSEGLFLEKRTPQDRYPHWAHQVRRTVNDYPLS